MWEGNLALLVESSFEAVVTKSDIVSNLTTVASRQIYFSLSTLGSIMTVSVLISASQQ